MKAAPKTAMPRSRAGSAYELLNDVVGAIRAEPRRLWMPTWILSRKEFKHAFGTRRGPACGTAGCVAGWMVLLHDGRRRALQAARAESVGERAHELLGCEPGLLFEGGVCDDRGQEVRPFTRGYVDAVVDRIRRFQGANQAALRQRRYR
jgi:hypothetical protein